MAATLTSSPRARIPRLPDFVEPMLAKLSPAPFDSDAWWYELKWDGFRALAFMEAGKVRLVGRRGTDFTPRFPELDVLKKLPAGTVLDGEIVHLTNGKPDFHALLNRERWYSRSKHPDAKRMAKERPVSFVAFDLLYERGRSVMPLPLFERRTRLDKLVPKHLGTKLSLSQGQIGGGLALFADANQRKLEGVMAKRLDSAYEPGVRSSAWLKFKQRQSIPCVILGYEPSTSRGIKSLIIAADVDGELRFAGQVGSGLGGMVASRLLRLFKSIPVDRPFVPAQVPHAKWVRPDIMCKISFAEWTNDGRLRQPVFEGVIES
jgi:bifunctional non-homologous end joining protein LigD